MARSPRFKIYDARGDYQAACKEPEAAATLVGFYGDGSRVKYLHRHVVFTEGEDGEALDSYDIAARLMMDRVHAILMGGRT